MSKASESTSYKVFAFMVSAHQLLVVSQDGCKLATVDVDSDVAAKEKLANEDFNQEMVVALKRSDFSLIWVNDPAGTPEVIDACKKMEERPAAETDPDTEPATSDTDSQTGTEQETPEGAKTVFEVRTINDLGKVIFQIFHDGLWVDVPGYAMKKGDTCRFYPEGSEQIETEYVLIEAPETISEEKGDYLIKLQLKKDFDAAAEQESNEPKFPQEKTQLIDVECEETFTEEKIKKIVRKLQSLKLESLAVAGQYREDIKACEKELFAACNGKSFTQMKCRVIEDWEAGVRRFIRPDNGEVALTQAIPYEERQLKLNIAEQQTSEVVDATEDERPDDAETGEQLPGSDLPPAGETENAIEDESTPEAVDTSADDDFLPPEGAEKGD
jgi:hypothetical protein